MQATDGRMLNREALREWHRQIIRAFKRGRNKAMISRDIGVSYSTVCRTIWRYEAGDGDAGAAAQRSAQG